VLTSQFVTGTDTGVGKTHVALYLMKQARRQGLRVAGYKPIASGCELIDGVWKNSDALALQNASSIELDYSLINPYAFEPAIAPHIAASERGVNVDIGVIGENYQRIQEQVDVVIVEGAGGCLVPINNHHTMLDLAKHLALPVSLVVGLRLGCINHALLSIQAIQARALKLEALIFNPLQKEPIPRSNEIVATIKRFTGIESTLLLDFDA